MHLSIAYHPESDRQTEELNRCLQGYLCCMSGEHPGDWLQWLPLTEWWYNSTHHSTIHSSPYEVLYGQPPPHHNPYFVGASPIVMVDKSLQQRKVARKMLQYHLKRAQDRMKHQADKHKSERQFNLGDLVYLRLQPYGQHSVKKRWNQKLSQSILDHFQWKLG